MNQPVLRDGAPADVAPADRPAAPGADATAADVLLEEVGTDSAVDHAAIAPDAPAVDAPEPDAGSGDAGAEDASAGDAGSEDAGDTGAADTGSGDAGAEDAASDGGLSQEPDALADGLCGAEGREIGNFFSYTMAYRAAGVAVDGEHIFVALQNAQSPTDGRVARCPIRGCGADNVDAINVVTGVNNPRYLLVAGGTLYIGAEGSVGSQADGYILDCPLAGCPVPFYPQATLAVQLMNMAGIDKSGDHLYFGHGTLATAIGRVHLPTRTPETIVPAPNYGTIGLVTDGTYAYWSQQNNPRTIYRVHAETHVVTPLLGEESGGWHRHALTRRGGGLYWVGTGTGDVWRMDLDGQNLRPLASGQTASGLAVDDTHAYWFNRYGQFEIMGVALAPDSMPRELARSTGQPSAIAQSGPCLYWTTEGGALSTVAK